MPERQRLVLRHLLVVTARFQAHQSAIRAPHARRRARLLAPPGSLPDRQCQTLWLRVLLPGLQRLPRHQPAAHALPQARPSENPAHRARRQARLGERLQRLRVQRNRCPQQPELLRPQSLPPVHQQALYALLPTHPSGCPAHLAARQFRPVWTPDPPAGRQSLHRACLPEPATHR